MNCNKDKKKKKALDLSSNGRMSAWVRTPPAVIHFCYIRLVFGLKMKSNIFTGTTAFIHPNEKRQNEMGIQVYISCHIHIILI